MARKEDVPNRQYIDEFRRETARAGQQLAAQDTL